MEVNAMPGLVLDESDREESYGDVNTMQSGEYCHFYKQSGQLKGNCKRFEEWKKKNPIRKNNTISCFNCGKPGHYSRNCRGERSGNMEVELTVKEEKDTWRKWKRSSRI